MTFLEIYGHWPGSHPGADDSAVAGQPGAEEFQHCGYLLGNRALCIAAWFYFPAHAGRFSAAQAADRALVTIWGLRLTIHIFIRNWGKPEDFRYQKWREKTASSWWWRSFFKVFLLQGILLWIISIPLLAAQFSSQPARLTVFGFRRRSSLADRLLLRSRWRLPIGALQGQPGQQGQGHEQRRVALHPPPQLLWRCRPVVGLSS